MNDLIRSGAFDMFLNMFSGTKSVFVSGNGTSGRTSLLQRKGKQLGFDIPDSEDDSDDTEEVPYIELGE